MNKKAFVFLYLCSIAFVISIAIFYGTVDKQTPGQESLYFGEKEINLFTSYQEAEEEVYFLELSARLAAKEASTENFEKEFEEKFGNYLLGTGLGVKDFDFVYEEGDSEMKIVAKSSAILTYYPDSFSKYTLTPSFSVTVPFETEEEEGFIG